MREIRSLILFVVIAAGIMWFVRSGLYDDLAGRAGSKVRDQVVDVRATTTTTSTTSTSVPG